MLLRMRRRADRRMTEVRRTAVGRVNDDCGVTEPLEGLFAALRSALGLGRRESNLATLEGIGDWEAVAGLARRHWVGSLAFRGVCRYGPPQEAAEAALAPLRRVASVRGLTQLAGLGKALDCMEKHGVPSLVLKGLPLSARLFGTPLARECYDIDLLVPPSAVAAAERALFLGGWKLRLPSFRPTPARIQWYDLFVKDRLLVGPGGALELHHRLTDNPHLLPLRFENLRANAASVQIGGFSANALGDDDLLVYLCVHGQMHRWNHLKWLCDVAALVASMEAHRVAAAVEKCRRLGLRLEPVFGAALRLCRDAMHIELPASAASLACGARAGRSAARTRRLWGRPGGAKGLSRAAQRLYRWRMGRAMNPSWRSASRELARLCATFLHLGRANPPNGRQHRRRRFMGRESS